MKQLIAIMLAAMLLLSLAGCAPDNSDATNDTTEPSDLSEHIDMLGYAIGYPTNVSISNARNGKTFCVDDDVIVYIGAPAYGGAMKSAETPDLDQIVSLCETEVCETVWSSTHVIANFTDPTQIVEETEKITVNDIPMLKVTGYFTTMRDMEPNTEKPKVEYVAYYMYQGIDNNTVYEPVYILGIKWNAESAEPLMDAMAAIIHDSIS